MNLKIEKNIPFPEHSEKINFVKQFEVGDSVLVDSLSDACSLTTAARRVGLKFSQRKVEDGIRVWRIK